MALQTSGSISFANLQSQFGGVNPISFSEYYKGGSYVLNSVDETVTIGPVYTLGVSSWAYKNSSGYTIYINVNVTLANGTPFTASHTYNNASLAAASNTTSYTANGYTYYRGVFVENRGGYRTPTTGYYKISLTYRNQAVRNVNVVSSGAISLSQFYGAGN